MKKHVLSLTLAGLLSTMFSCRDLTEQKAVPQQQTPQSNRMRVEQYAPNVAGTIEEFSNGNSSVRFTVKNGVYSIGDVFFTQEQVDNIKKSLNSDRKARTVGLSNYSELWPNGVVYFTIDENLPNQARVTNAIAHCEQVTGITFVARTTQTDYVRFIAGDGCASRLGRVGGMQDVILGAECGTGEVIHEIGHVLGLFHEMARTDRDNFIDIYYDNVPSVFWPQFSKHTDTPFQGFQTNSFDWGSIMLYGSYDGSWNNNPVMKRKNGTTFSAQRNGYSTADTYMINRMYFNARTRIRPQVIEDYTDGGGNQILTVDNYLEFYADDAYTVPLTLNKQNRVPIRVYNRNGSVSAYYVTVPSGTHSYLLGRTTSSCHYNQYGEVDGECYQEGIGLDGAWH